MNNDNFYWTQKKTLDVGLTPLFAPSCACGTFKLIQEGDQAYDEWGRGAGNGALCTKMLVAIGT